MSSQDSLVAGWLSLAYVDSSQPLHTGHSGFRSRQSSEILTLEYEIPDELTLNYDEQTQALSSFFGGGQVVA